MHNNFYFDLNLG